jgi:beta-galactosidase
MNKWISGCLWGICALFLLIMTGCADSIAGRRDLNTGWRFTKGEQPAEAAAMNFDDSDWQPVRLPHDWAIAGPFNPEEHGYAGKLPWKGVGWYRQTFTLNAADAGKPVYLEFDGVMAFPKVYVNGQLAGQWDYGYVPFRVDATPYVRFGQKNTLAVEVDTRKQGTRWYPGAGIYRKVKLTLCNPIHIGHWATFVATPQVGDNHATVLVQTALENHRDAAVKTEVTFEVLSPDGRTVARRTQSATVSAGASAPLDQRINITNPLRWDIVSPHLYTLVTTVRADGRVVDRQRTGFGIRTFEFTAADGFHLNGRRVQIYGVNLHHDHGPLGAAFYTRAMDRQLEIMRDMGVNTIRTSHNAPATDLLDLCDRMGFVVWNEIFDKWDHTAGRVGAEPPLEEYGEKQIRNFVLRDRNHPCVVAWSIGNEIANLPGSREGKSGPRVTFMRDFFLKYDPTRPVGMGCHIPQTANQPILDALDLTGWNYMRRYSIYRERYPDKPIVYSESASTLSTRGFTNCPADGQDRLLCAASGLFVRSQRRVMVGYSRCGICVDGKRQLCGGEMVWTGFDYLGEPTPFDQEARSSYFGIVDLCGIPKDRFYLYRSHWRPDETTVHILPHWNWPDRVGKNVPVFVYTNGDQAELFLNGKSLGRRIKGQRPPKPVNFAQGAAITASSQQTEHPAAAMLDENSDTRWCAASAQTEQWLQIDLGQVRPIRYLALDFEREAKYYGYTITVSTDGDNWTEAAAKAGSDRPQWGGARQMFHSVQADARYLRIGFTELRERTWASIRSFGVYPEPVESDYYAPTYDYRLRWNEVVYQPGELKAVAYKDGKRIGEAVMRTAGQPAKIRLTPDRRELAATGEDLSYILVEALDENGTLCPLADNLIHFKVQGPAVIAGVGNGNPLSFEPFQADYRKLFYGKAMLIVRSEEGKSGRVQITAAARLARWKNRSSRCSIEIVFLCR